MESIDGIEYITSFDFKMDREKTHNRKSEHVSKISQTAEVGGDFPRQPLTLGEEVYRHSVLHTRVGLWLLLLQAEEF